MLPELPSSTVITPPAPVKLAAARVKVLAAPLASPIVVKPETLVRLSLPVLAKSSVAPPLPCSAPFTVTPLSTSVVPAAADTLAPAAIVTLAKVPGSEEKLSIVPAPAKAPPEMVPP